MIYGKQKDAGRYRGIDENLDLALDFIEKQDYSGVVPGKNVLSGEDVYINCFSYDTMESSEGFFEAHDKYLDVHVVLEGKERIETADRSLLEEFESDPETDYTGYHGVAEAVCTMKPGDFLVVFPEDAHKVKVKDETSCHVNKAVFKVWLCDKK
ncbi:MAG: YhcH/YjgK/YiaL family protein [Lachnospiraceae bacterium]|nr:YhcH/YjgK/YiaL family protein [Lachnospiraceae bacterium]